MDISQILKDTENALRDFIALILSEQLGPEWTTECGVSSERLQKWRERKDVEAKRQDAGVVDDRLIYYADFYDLKTILKKHWQHFAPAFGDLKTMEVWLNEFQKLRDPDAHRRELLPHQKSLILGISGELRTKIARYRSNKETAESYYPRIEFAADNLGNSWKPGEKKCVETGMKLRPGDVLEFVVTASDPLEEPLEYQCAFETGSPPGGRNAWSKENTFIFVVTDEYVHNLFFAVVSVRSRRKYHAHTYYDDDVMFTYQVLPPK